MTQIQDQEILQKIIKMQSCMIQGKDLKVLLHKDRKFYLDKTDSDVITICMNEHEKVRPEYILENHRLFGHLVHKYVFENRSLDWDTFVKIHFPYLILNNKFFQTNDMYDIFKGLLTKREATSFNDELEMKNAIMMPIYDFERKNTIGILCYIFRREVEADIAKLEEVKKLFETLLQPLYDREHNIMYSKCVRVDEDYALLTEQEKRIAKQVLAGKAYPEIAKMLNISINTLKTHMKNIFNKYNVNSKIELYNKLNTHA